MADEFTPCSVDGCKRNAAIAAAALCTALLHPSPKVRKLTMAVVAALVIMVPIALLARPSGALLWHYLVSFDFQMAAGRPTCALNTDTYDSLSMRFALASDTFYLLPKAGFFGLGLGGFMAGSCLPGYETHDIVLQAFVEFGWVGGALLIALLAVGFRGGWRDAQGSDEARFVLGCLILMLAGYMVSGQLSRAVEVFAFLGLAGRYAEIRRA